MLLGCETVSNDRMNGQIKGMRDEYGGKREKELQG
jgi:hypothetical protein